MSGIWNTRDGLRQSPEWAELQSRLTEAERSAAMYKRIAEDQKQLNRDMRSTVNAVTGADADSRWNQLFGTPERAARTLYYGKQPICAGCALLDECDKMPDEERDTCLLVGYDDLLEWLRGDAE